MKKLIFNSLKSIFASFALFTISCASAPVVDDSMSAPELIQHGQGEFEVGNYKNALFYYNTAIDRYGDDGAIFVEASYEIGHIYTKQKKYDQAVPVLDSIVTIFDSVQPGVLPAAYKKLALLELNKIPSDKLEKIRADLKAKQEAEINLSAEQVEQ